MTSNRFTVAVIFVLLAVLNVALGKKVQSNLLRSNLNKKVTHDNSDKLAAAVNDLKIMELDAMQNNKHDYLNDANGHYKAIFMEYE